MNLQGGPECGDRNIQNFTEQPCWYSGIFPLDWQTCLEDITPTQVLIADASFLKHPAGNSMRKGVAFGPDVSDSARSFLPNAAPLPVNPICVHPRSSAFNLLIMRLDNIGDVIMTSTALRSLRENLPEANITLMASPDGAQVAPLLPWVNEVLPHRTLWQDLGKLPFNPQREWELIDTLHQRQFDAAILFTSSSQSPHPPALICALAGIPIRLGESKEQDLGTLTHSSPAITMPADLRSPPAP